jgi:hypothetical protein
MTQKNFVTEDVTHVEKRKALLFGQVPYQYTHEKIGLFKNDAFLNRYHYRDSDAIAYSLDTTRKKAGSRVSKHGWDYVCSNNPWWTAGEIGKTVWVPEDTLMSLGEHGCWVRLDIEQIAKTIAEDPEYAMNDPDVKAYFEERTQVRQKIEGLEKEIKALQNSVELPKPKEGQRIAVYTEGAIGLKTIAGIRGSEDCRCYGVSFRGVKDTFDWKWILEQEYEARKIIAREL